jgi:hypothetical protein
MRRVTELPDEAVIALVSRVPNAGQVTDADRIAIIVADSDKDVHLELSPDDAARLSDGIALALRHLREKRS